MQFCLPARLFILKGMEELEDEELADDEEVQEDEELEVWLNFRFLPTKFAGISPCIITSILSWADVASVEVGSIGVNDESGGRNKGWDEKRGNGLLIFRSIDEEEEEEEHDECIWIGSIFRIDWGPSSCSWTYDETKEEAGFFKGSSPTRKKTMESALSMQRSTII